MAFDLEGLRQAVAAHGRVARVVVAAVQGSTPREVGAAMLVWDRGQSGTIGGGALEFEAARNALAGDRLVRHPLGPALGQCCGGAVTLLSEVYDPARVAHLSSDVIARAVPGAGPMPLAVRRLLNAVRGAGVIADTRLVDGWMVEPVTRPTRELWIWGAGHVGRALVGVLAPLADLKITWIDTAADRFPPDPPQTVTILPAADPALLVTHAPAKAEHLILTYSHALDLELCHRLLGHGFATAGLIGSATKKARFRTRLGALGHAPEQIARIRCPIGDPSLGKQPHAIAISVAADLLRTAKLQERSLRA